MHRFAKSLAAAAFAALIATAAQAQGYYTVNGQVATPQQAQLFAANGLPPGAYYIDQYGNFGRVGQPPMFNVRGGPPQYPNARAPSGPRPPQGGYPAPGAGGGGAQGSYGNLEQRLIGARVFWVSSPGLFSGARGGASGYIHFCSGNVFHTSSEGSVSVGGGYRSRLGPGGDPYGDQTGRNGPWAGAAGTSRGGGRWRIEPGQGGPVVALYHANGNKQTVPVATVAQGRWKFGRTKYAIESGRASCR